LPSHHPAAERRAPLSLFAPVRTRRTVDTVVDQIVSRIRSGDLAQGESLPAERQLAAQMEVSRRTIREAAKILSEGGIIDVEPGPAGGMRISSIWIPAEMSTEAPARSADAIYQALEARRAIAINVAQLAAARATDDDFAAMGKAIDLQQEMSGNPIKMGHADRLFHRAMWRAAANATLEKAMNMIFDELQIAFDMTDRLPADIDIAIRLQKELLDALVGADVSHVEKTMDGHLRYLEGVCEDVLGRPRRRKLPKLLDPGAGGDPDET